MRNCKLIYVVLFLTQVVAAQQNQTDSAGKQGYWKTYRQWDGKDFLAEEGFYKNNKKEGTWKQYYADGTMKFMIEFHDGKPEGAAMTFFEDGSVQDSGISRKSRWVGWQYEYYQSTHRLKAKNLFDDNGKKLLREFYFESGELQMKTKYEKGCSVNSKIFFKSGNISEISYGDTLTVSFNEEGYKKTETWYDKWKKKTRQIRYSVKGKTISDLSYNDAQQHGMCILYHPNGKVKLKCEYKNGYMHSERMYYDSLGHPENGNFIWYYNNGIKEREGRCKRGRPYGEMKTYSENGNVRLIGYFKKGKPHGNFTYYWKGKVNSIDQYINGTFFKQVYVVPVAPEGFIAK